MRNWPNTIPLDLKCKLEGLRECRSYLLLIDEKGELSNGCNGMMAKRPRMTCPLNLNGRNKAVIEGLAVQST